MRAQAGHEHRTQPGGGRLDDGLDELDAAVAQLVSEFHDQDAVLAGDADQHDSADLAEDVDVESNSHSPSSAPLSASGTVTRMTIGWMKLSNCAASTR